METDEGEHERLIPFQLQFDKPLASQIKLAEWNPEKDLLAMVTEDSKVMLHRFNWQRLWTISPGKCILSICWRPDGKAIALGLEDGTVLLHNVENGKLLRSLKSHTAAVVSLNWEQDAQVQKNGSGNVLSFEDRTPRFFPAAPRVPSMPGLIPGDAALTDDGQDSFLELSNSSDQRFNILCSGDKDGSLCFSIFGIFPIGKLNIHSCKIPYMLEGNQIICRLLNASIGKVTLSKDLCHLIVTCHGELSEDNVESRDTQLAGHNIHGLHCLVLDTSIFQKRKNELHQVALQASNIEDLNEVVRTSLSVMRKQWSDAMSTFHEKFDSLSNLIINHGIDSSPQEELLSLLGGARTSPPVHQFLVNTLGEVAMKRVSKSVCSAGRELQLIVLNHLQPAVETIGFRLGELRGLSRWRARYQGIGLDEALTSSAAEKAGMLLIQVERFTRVLSSVVQQFANFFLWLLKCIKILMSEPSDQLSTYDSELVVVFLKYLYDQDPVKQLLEASEVDHEIEIDIETMQRVRKLIKLGGFADCEYLRRTLAKEFQQMEDSFKEAVEMPFSTISRKIICRSVVPLSPLAASPPTAAMLPVSVSYYETSKNSFGDYICFQIPDESFPDISNCVAMVRGSVSGPLQATLFSIPKGYRCVDLSLYKESQVVLLLNHDQSSSSGGGGGCMMIVEASELPFVEITGVNCWQLKEECMVQLEMENEKVRSIPHAVVAPLAVSASRGLACVFGAKKRALVYILEEDEDEATDAS